MEMRQGYAAINGTQLISSWLDQGTRWCSFTDSPGIAVFLTINLRLSLSAPSHSLRLARLWKIRPAYFRAV